MESNNAKEEINAEQSLRELVQNKKNDFAESNETEKESIPEEILKNANNYFLIKILSPEITKNETKKRKHKEDLLNIIKMFLIMQFILLSILLLGIITMIFVFHGLKNDLSISYIKLIISVISAYITSIVIELIAMLRYIVSKVFDTSISGLVSLYKDTSTNFQKEL
jgi:membrane glycosyltransferase